MYGSRAACALLLQRRAAGSQVGERRDEQRVVALTIIQREIGLMALAAAVNTVLLWRAAATA